MTIPETDTHSAHSWRISSVVRDVLLVVLGAVGADRLRFSGVFNPAHTLSTAWQTARDTRALGELPYAVALRLGSLYEQQEQYSRIAATLDEAITTRIQAEGIQTGFLDRWANLIFLNQDFMGRAEGLASRYERTLAFLDSVKVPVAARYHAAGMSAQATPSAPR